MKLSWKESKSYTGFVKFIGKMAGTGTPRCFYLGREKAQAELTAAKLTVAYRNLIKFGHTGWTAASIRAVLNGPSLQAVAPQANPALVPASFAVGSCLNTGRSGLTFYEGLVAYLAYEKQRAPGQISWMHYFGIRCRIRFIKRHVKNQPLATIGYDELARFISLIAARPMSKYWGRKIGVVTAHDTIKELRTIFDWFDLSGRWDGPKRFDRIFKIRRRNLMTSEERDVERRGIETFTVDELKQIMLKARCKWHRVVIATALNLGMTQNELATLRRRHIIGLDTDSPVIEKSREKTDVFCRWGFIFPEVAEGLRWVLSTHPYELVFSGAKGEPLVAMDEKNRRDTVQHFWYKLVKTCGTKYLPFRFLRKTSADMLRKLSDRDTSEAFLSHVNDGVSKFYTNHDWDKLAAAMKLLYEKLKPIFEVPDAPKLLPQMRLHRSVPKLKGKTRNSREFPKSSDMP